LYWLSGRTFRIPVVSWPIWKTGCAAVLACAAWHVLVAALASPTDWDVLAYHLAVPKLYYSHGGVLEIPWLLHSHWPHLMETLYVIPLDLGRDNVAALIHAGACAALVSAVFAAAYEEWGGLAAWTSAALLAAQPVM